VVRSIKNAVENDSRLEVSMKVKLDDVLEAIELASDEYEYFYNIETGETVMYADSLITGIDNGELEADLEENYDKYIKLPTKFDINEYHIMEEFIWNLPTGKIQDKLEKAVQGRGAFRRFKEMVYDLGIEKKWFDYEAESYKKIAIEWCKYNDIEYS
jgi:hypothetical protein